MLIRLINMPLWIFLLILLAIAVLLTLVAIQKKTNRAASIASGLLVSLVTIGLLLGMGEAYYRFVYADSGWGFTLAHKNWESRYWQVNSRGFRDSEWAESDFEGRSTIAVLGDSFASGWGVNNPDDRFPDVLANLLGDDYAVVNLAIPGTSTPQQLELLQNNPPEQPDIVLLQYFLNDIELASASVSRLWVDEFVTAPDAGSIAEQSYLGNFIYWILYPRTRTVNATFEGSYWDWQYATYDINSIWEIHAQQLNDFIDAIEALDADLYVVIFPNMEDAVRRVPYVDRVKFVFEARGYGDHVMTLYDEVAAWDRAESIVASPRDAHPSAAFHRYVGQILYERWFTGD
ncbi:MAG: SGNH/GDSL hydrolase family protein [Anaerolineae bacterium]|nr:SGNH/GDSL hydrolase family protein [Anaerolineae bacterium]